MTKIHHTQHKFAAKLGLVLAINDGMFQAFKGDKVVDQDADLKALLARLDAARTEGGAAPATKGVLAKKSAKKAARKTMKKAHKASDEDGDGEGDEEELPASVVKGKYKAAYAEHGGNCGDAMAKAFSAASQSDGALDLDAIAHIAKANGVDWKARWGHLLGRRGGPGMVRMNLSNVLRGMIRQGSDVVIGKQKFQGELQTEKRAKARKAAKK